MFKSKSKEIPTNFTQCGETLTVSSMIESLVQSNLLPSTITSRNWQENIKSIVDYLKNTSKIDGYLTFNVLLKNVPDYDYFNGSLLDPDGYRLEEKYEKKFDIFTSIYHKRNFLYKEVSNVFVDFVQKSQLKYAMKITKLAKNATLVLREQKVFDIPLFDEIGPINWSILEEIDKYREKELREIEAQFDDLLTINIPIEVKIKTSSILQGILRKLANIEAVVQKEDFVKKFEDKKKEKKQLGDKYFNISRCIFFVIIFINTASLIAHWGCSKTVSDFIKFFLGYGIYGFVIEVLLTILAFYFLGLFKTYTKTVELYDSYILLIESDFFYKNDEHFQNSKNIQLFNLRKENTQRIHTLPEKMFAILNQKEEVKETSPLLQVASKILELGERMLKKP